MIYLVCSVVCFIVFMWAKGKVTNDWLRLCSEICGGSSVNYRYLIVTIVSLTLTIVFGWLCHHTVINYINKLMS